ncbi:arylsulfatase [Novosphingobium malaysiense]|uniref:Arylsulfatase n=1 Tax=Novosphingobium malaysiense TaxID=1348853 RepID=A0A0B1ZKE6_9SPHN|nr:arylsulfatase [Novosphingobium malaysiense]
MLTDDVGFGAASAFGGPVPTPNLERLAQNGLKYTRFHTTAMCSPTRAALLTGRNHHAVGTGSLTDFAMGAPGYTGMIPKSAATIGEVLRELGYSTAWFGKHHNVPKGPFSGAGPLDYMPNHLGFDYFYGFIGSDTDQWYPTLYRNGVRVIDDADQPILDQRLADDAIHWIHQQQANGQGKPFFIYYAPGSAHTPHQAPTEWIDRFRGQFAAGWEVVRKQTLARQKAMGLIPGNTKLPPWPDDLPHWDDLAPKERAFQQRAMEAFAAQLAFQDAQFGRLLDELARMDELDNTLIVFIEGDNGPDAAASPDGSLAEGGEHANRKLSQEEHWSMIDRLGGPSAGSNYGSAWAQAMASPFPYYKQIASHLGGTRNGMVISWPDGIAARGIRTQYSHVIDVYPTLLDAAGIVVPQEVGGIPQQPVDGIDLSYSFADAQAPSQRKTQYYEMLGNRAIYDDGWLAATKPVRQPWKMASGPDAAINKAPDYEWGLYDLRHDFNETQDLAARYPDRLDALKKVFDQQALRYHVYPVNDRTDMTRVTLGARAYVAPRDHYVYWGKGLTIARDDAPQMAARSFTITAHVTGGDGVLLATGSRRGGWSFGIRDGHPFAHQAFTLMPSDQFELVSPQIVSSGQDVTLTFDFDYDGGGMGKGGIVSIAIDGRKVAHGRVEQSILVGDPVNETFDIGLDTGVPVVEVRSPSNSFTGDLKKLSVDLGPIGSHR